MNKKNMNNFLHRKAILFDMDGVIADSEGGNMLAFIQMLHQAGVDVDEDYLSQFSGATIPHIWSVLKTQYHLPESTDHYIKEYFEVRNNIVAENGLKPMPGCVELILSLHSHGVPLAVASGSSREDIVNNMETFGILDCFEVIISGWECSHGKPDPEIYLTAAKAVHTAPANCIVVEDSVNGMCAAKAAGMFCVGYVPPQSFARDTSVADIIVHHFNELSEMIFSPLPLTTSKI